MKPVGPGSYWWAVTLLAVIGGGLGVAAGSQKAVTYTAESQLSVGQASIANQSLAGYARGAQDLASSYSRVAQGQQVVASAARAVGQDPRDAVGRVSASPIPESQLFKIEATGSSAPRAISLSDAVRRQTTRYITEQTGSSDANTQRLYDRFLRFAESAASHGVTADALAARRRRDAGAVSTARVAEARSLQAGAQLLADTYSAQFQAARAQSGLSSKDVAVVSRPLTASSDRNANLQKFGFAGVVGGAFVGLALALLLARRRVRAA